MPIGASRWWFDGRSSSGRPVRRSCDGAGRLRDRRRFLEPLSSPLHVFVIPGTLLGALAVHLWLVLKCGISAAPVPGQTVDPQDV